MARYLVLEKSYINLRIVEAGEEIEYDGLPSANLKPLDKAGEKQAVEYEKTNDARVQIMKEQNAPVASVDSEVIAAAVVAGMSQVMNK